MTDMPLDLPRLQDDPDLKLAPAVFRTLVRICAENWRYGTVTYILPSGRSIPIKGSEPGPNGVLKVRDYRFVGRVFRAGDIGFAEGYMAGEWETPDLAALLTVFTLNFDRIKALVDGNPLMRAVNFIGHLLHANTRKGSAKNIHAHYDLGNAFYSRWLDPSMTYSSAKFDPTHQSLEQGQHEKYAALAQTMNLAPGQKVLEIGCGWGGFAEFAAKERGAHVTGITISREQYDFARKRIFEAGLSERADIKLIDYRDIDGRFDRVASIEMFEAVGEAYWPTYFNKVHDVLSPGGLAALQIITIRDDLFSHYRSRADFIQKYIFPGGMLPSEARLNQETAKAGLQQRALVRFAQDYADTLAEWARRFEAAWSDIKPLGFDERFRRLWKFYLAYCEAGFRTERTNVIQLGLARG